MQPANVSNTRAYAIAAMITLGFEDGRLLKSISLAMWLFTCDDSMLKW